MPSRLAQPCHIEAEHPRASSTWFNSGRHPRGSPVSTGTRWVRSTGWLFYIQRNLLPSVQVNGSSFRLWLSLPNEQSWWKETAVMWWCLAASRKPVMIFTLMVVLLGIIVTELKIGLLTCGHIPSTMQWARWMEEVEHRLGFMWPQGTLAGTGSCPVSQANGSYLGKPSERS